MWFKIQGQQVKLRIIAKPNAKKTTLVNISEEGLQIAIHAKPHKGEANKKLIAYLAELLRVPKSHISLDAGENSKFKQVTVPLTANVEKFLQDPAGFF